MPNLIQLTLPSSPLSVWLTNTLKSARYPTYLAPRLIERVLQLCRLSKAGIAPHALTFTLSCY